MVMVIVMVTVMVKVMVKVMVIVMVVVIVIGGDGDSDGNGAVDNSARGCQGIGSVKSGSTCFEKKLAYDSWDDKNFQFRIWI
jgi:hypothetical protein